MERLIGTYKDREVYADDEAQAIRLGGSKVPPMRYAWEFNGNFRQWVERRIGWTIPSGSESR